MPSPRSPSSPPHTMRRPTFGRSTKSSAPRSSRSGPGSSSSSMMPATTARARRSTRSRPATLGSPEFGSSGEAVSLLPYSLARRSPRASVVASLDADLQNDPADLPRLVRLLETSGADLVAGVREKRADHPWRRISSSIANRVRRAVLNERFRDSACGIKVVRRDAFLALEPFDGMHRFLPGLIERSGGLVVEAPVHHRPRVAGRSKYTTCNRLARATRDMLRLRAAGLHSSCRSST